MASAYGNTGNTTTTATPGEVYHPTTNVLIADSTQTADINSNVIANFLASLPLSEQAVPPVYLDGADSIGVDAYSYALVGQNSAIDFSASQADNGAQVGLNITIDSGSNTVTLNKGPDIVSSTLGNDTIRSSGGRDTINGGSGQDSIIGGGKSYVTGGSGGADTLVGGLQQNSHDTISSGIGGGALIEAKLGHNVIYGNTNDTIKAGQSKDTIDAGFGSQTISGGHGANITGGGLSSISGGTGNTVYLQGSDTLTGGNGNKVTIGGDSSVFVNEKSGTNLEVTVQASGHGNDTLFGGSGGLTVHVAQLGTYTEQTTGTGSNAVHTLTFASGDVLTVNGSVTLDLAHGHTKTV